MHDVALSNFCESRGWLLTEHPLKSMPDCRHWHIRKVGEKGTVEVTLCPNQRIEIEVRKNRTAPWTVQAMKDLEGFFRSI
jgi:hypothetical protein